MIRWDICAVLLPYWTVVHSFYQAMPSLPPYSLNGSMETVWRACNSTLVRIWEVCTRIKVQIFSKFAWTVPSWYFLWFDILRFRVWIWRQGCKHLITIGNKYSYVWNGLYGFLVSFVHKFIGIVRSAVLYLLCFLLVKVDSLPKRSEKGERNGNITHHRLVRFL